MITAAAGAANDAIVPAGALGGLAAVAFAADGDVTALAVAAVTVGAVGADPDGVVVVAEGVAALTLGTRVTLVDPAAVATIAGGTKRHIPAIHT
jgi:hypothetical protein